MKLRLMAFKKENDGDSEKMFEHLVSTSVPIGQGLCFLSL